MPFPVATGAYLLTTSAIEGDCRLANALGPGPAMLGRTLPVEVTASGVAIEVAVCGHAAEDLRCVGAGDAFDFELRRDGDTVTGGQLWLVPGCGDVHVEAALRAEGDITAPNTLNIAWSATISTADPAWTCAGFAPCRATVQQQLGSP